MNLINSLINTISSHGDQGAIVPYSRISSLKEDMLKLKNGDFHTTWTDRMANYITHEDDKFIPVDAQKFGSTLEKK